MGTTEIGWQHIPQILKRLCDLVGAGNPRGLTAMPKSEREIGVAVRLALMAELDGRDLPAVPSHQPNFERSVRLSVIRPALAELRRMTQEAARIHQRLDEINLLLKPATWEELFPANSTETATSEAAARADISQPLAPIVGHGEN